MWINVRSVFGAWIPTHSLQDTSLLLNHQTSNSFYFKQNCLSEAVEFKSLNDEMGVCVYERERGNWLERRDKIEQST